ncbi:MAG: zinc-binding dehydrogenase [Chloroflexi bacterium]|nr:zinc-binding dehydrogenase [Chloroflexota bacterium]
MNAIAAVLTAFNQPLALQEIPVPELTPGQVLVQVEAAGICGSDVHMWHGKDPRTPLPIILGHEGVGRVVAIAGSRLDIYGQVLDPGQRILWERGVSCGLCYYCQGLHEPALCPNRWAYGIHRPSNRPPYLVGCYATHLVLDAHTPLIPHAETDDPATYVSASCSGATAAHGFDQIKQRPGDTCVVYGPGPLGAYSVALARAGGAEQVMVIGGSPARLALCKNLGATHLLDRHALSAEQQRQAVFEVTRGRGADLVVEASGSLSAAHEGLDLLRPGGTLLLVGFGTPIGEMNIAPFEAVVRKNVRIQGVWVSDTAHTLHAVSLVRQHPNEFAALVTHRFALTQATEALRVVTDRSALKAVLLPNF